MVRRYWLYSPRAQTPSTASPSREGSACYGVDTPGHQYHTVLTITHLCIKISSLLLVSTALHVRLGGDEHRASIPQPGCSALTNVNSRSDITALMRGCERYGSAYSRPARYNGMDRISPCWASSGRSLESKVTMGCERHISRVILGLK